MNKLLEKFLKKSKELSDNSDEEAPKEYDMGLFVRHYNRYLKRIKLNHSYKCLEIFKIFHAPIIEYNIKDDEIACYECRKLRHCRTTCPSVTP